jgi:hypothetical protein
LACRSRSLAQASEKTRIAALPLAAAAPQGSVALCAPVLRTPLSLAEIERARRDTLYVATVGGMGPASIAALQQILLVLATDPAGILIAATDADSADRRYAARLRQLVSDAAVPFDAILPPDWLNDWNDALCAMTPDDARILLSAGWQSNEHHLSLNVYDGWPQDIIDLSPPTRVDI